MFRITSGKGFHIVFPNGVTFSTQFGAGNYCDNRHDLVEHELQLHLHKVSSNCEIGIWRDSGAWCTGEAARAAGLEDEFGGDVVAGYVSVENWLKLLNAAANLPCRRTEMEYKGDQNDE